MRASAGQAHESKFFEETMNAVRIRRSNGRTKQRPACVAGDKAYSVRRIRQWLRARSIGAVIPQRTDQRRLHRGRPLKFDRKAYRRRNVIERCVGWLKECRRIVTRFEKLALNFLGMVKLAFIQRYLRLLDSPDRA